MKKKNIIIILGIVLGIIILGGTIFFAISERTVAKVPDPVEFFGNGTKDSAGLYDIAYMFESETDPAERIEAYINEIKENEKDIWIRVVDHNDQEKEYILTYDGFWLGETRPVLKIHDYRNDYYGDDSDNKNYVFSFYCQSNFKFVSMGEYDSSENGEKGSASSEKKDDSSKGNTSSNKKPVAITGPTLPDISAFLGGVQPQDSHKADVSGWQLYFRTEIDEGWSAAHEYVELLQEPRFNFTLREHKTDNILYLKQDLYFFDYTGNKKITPAQDRFYEDGYVDFSADVFIWIQKNGRDEYTGISIYYSEDLEVKDLGDRASSAPDYQSGSSNKDETPKVDYETPDFAKLPCLTCDGKKDCTKCNGYGTIKRYNGKGETIDSLCPVCHGNRKCKSCNGTGTR